MSERFSDTQKFRDDLDRWLTTPPDEKEDTVSIDNARSIADLPDCPYTADQLDTIRENLRRAGLSQDLTPGGYTYDELDRALNAPDWNAYRLRCYIIPTRPDDFDED